ncbi:OsmC family protein [Azospirillum himalayense]|uniref:OsmC family protein n=1 Tax=Azospirillum himalayense TaxID=654847 RepID=A0ABW0G3F4_9PROT
MIEPTFRPARSSNNRINRSVDHPAPTGFRLGMMRFLFACPPNPARRKDAAMRKPPAPEAGRSPSSPKPEPPPRIDEEKRNPNAVRTLRCRTVAQGRFQQRNYIRDLPAQPVMEDEPGGPLNGNAAPTASEALLAALGSCLAVGIHADAVARHILVHRLELEVEAEIDTTAGWAIGNAEPRPIGFEAIRVIVHLDADAPRDVLAALVKHAALWSPVSNTLHNPVHLDVILADPHP